MNELDILVNQIKKSIKILVHPCYENTAGSWIYCRCPECGDSKDRSKAHFYIEMKPPFRCYCQKCQFSSSRLTNELLNKLNIYDNSLIMNINEANKLAKTSNRTLSITKKENNKFTYNDEKDITSIASLEYFNKRYNVNLTMEDLNTNFKCVLNPARFLNSKKVQPDARFDFSKAIGFLSSDNKYMICRDTSNMQERRYANVSLSDDADKSKCYNIRTKIDLMQDKITLVITEGIFDAIGIYLKEYKDKENVIVAAGCGKSFSKVIKKYIEMGFLNLDIIIYSDADVDISFYRKLKNDMFYLKNTHLTIYYNMLEKDCGVPADRIQLKRMVI